MSAAIRELLNHPIAYHSKLARVAGSVTAGLLLSQMLYWNDRCPEGRKGWWWHTQAEWEQETALSRREQETARNRLLNLGIIKERLEGLPARLWFRLDVAKLEEILILDQKHGGMRRTRKAINAKTVSPKKPRKVRRKRLPPETTAWIPPQTSPPTDLEQDEGRGAEDVGQIAKNFDGVVDEAAELIRLLEKYPPSNIRNLKRFLSWKSMLIRKQGLSEIDREQLRGLLAEESGVFSTSQEVSKDMAVFFGYLSFGEVENV